MLAHPVCDALIFAVVLLSAALIGASDTMVAQYGEVYRGLNIAIVTVFCVESIARAVVQGLVLGPGSYWRTVMGVVDTLVVVGGILDQLPGLPAISLVALVWVVC